MGIATRMKAVGGGGINKYNLCKDKTDMKCINQRYWEDLDVNKEWNYNLNGMTNSQSLFFPGWGANPFWRCNAKKIKTSFASLTNLTTHTFAALNGTTHLEVEIPIATNIGQFIADSGLKHVKLYAPKVKTISMVVWGGGLANLDFDVELPSLDAGGTWGGYNGYISVESAKKILNSLPSYTSGTHTLNEFEIHVDGKNDEELLQIIDKVKNNGWTLNVVWRGTATKK